MQKKLLYFDIAGILFTLALGTVLHFTYEWSGNYPPAGVFSSVNESIWEHLKLLFMPVLLFTLFEYFLFAGAVNNFLLSRSIGVLSGMFFIVSFYYTYTGILGENFLWMDLLSFFLGTILTYVIGHFLLLKLKNRKSLDLAGWLLFLGLFLCFTIFTVHPPELPLFQPPIP